MGIWNSHTSVGNILGSLIAGVWVSSAWGLSFIVPGIIIAAVGIICFFFLVECEWCDPGCSANAKRNGAISLLTQPQAFLATPNTYCQLGASGDADPTATGLLGIRRLTQAGSAPVPLAPLSLNFLGKMWEALWDFTGVFRCREAGTRRCSPARGVPSPASLPCGVRCWREGRRGRAGPGSHGISSPPADPEDVGCSPPLHHVSRPDSQGAGPGLGAGSVYSGTTGALGRNGRN